MTREKAKDYIREWCPYDRQDEIIKALEQDPCEDAIRREEMLQKVDRRIGKTVRTRESIEKDNEGKTYIDGLFDAYSRIKCDIAKIPSVQPEQKTGQWVDNHNGTYTCDSCGCKHSRSKFCPNCGAEMEVEE
jgi:hypothetical protein